MKERSILPSSITLRGESDGQGFPRTFERIALMSDRGASSLCYSAALPGNSPGVLKEFYPNDINGLTRDSRNNLVQEQVCDYERDRFAKRRERYLNTYRRVGAYRTALGDAIPYFELYTGIDDFGDPAGTIYVWTPEPARLTFAEICADIRKDPARQPEYAMVQILYAIESLTKAVRTLHSKGLLHRDINPSNFGFQKRGDEAIAQSISLFDIDTVCDINYNTAEVCGTSGFMEPEATQTHPLPADNTTDIFSIGATLFYAIIITDETKESGGRYDEKYYPRLRHLLETSALITSSDANAHPYLRQVLLRILQNCLAPREQRWTDCARLHREIRSALHYAVPAEITKHGAPGVKWVLADVSKALARRKEQRTTALLQHHLSVCPLYPEHTAPEKLTVLVVGFGRYGQRFTDIALQIAQMPCCHEEDGEIQSVTACNIEVTVISYNEDDLALYLQERPAMTRFIRVDKQPEPEEDCGTLHFRPENLTLKDVFTFRTMQPDHVFIATGRDKLNHQLAERFAMFAGRVSYIWENPDQRPKPGRAFPVFTTAESAAPDARLEEMAFNVHLVWEKNLNLKLAKVYSEFLYPYNHDACTAFALGMQYKLHGMNISLSDPMKAAAAYQEKLRSTEGLRPMLYYLEHRRWVVEKLCLGYDTWNDLERCTDDNTKDEQHKLHLCLRPGTPAMPLDDWPPETWDDPPPELLAALDPLDRLSVELHLTCLRQSREVRRHDLLHSAAVDELRRSAAHDPALLPLMQEWLACMHQIWEDGTQRGRYKGLQKAFFDAIPKSRLGKNRAAAALQTAAQLHRQFFPVLSATKRRIFKNDDIALMDRVPFILTHRDAWAFAVPYRTGDTTAVFENLAAAAAVNPRSIRFYAYCPDQDALTALLDSLPLLHHFIEQKALRAAVQFVVGFPPDVRTGSTRDLCRQFSVRTNGKLRQVIRCPVPDCAAFAAAVARDLPGEYWLESNDTPLSAALEQLHPDNPVFRYDSRAMQFTRADGCGALLHMKVQPGLSVPDLPAFPAADTNDPAFFPEYRQLWALYRQDPARWQAFCTALGEHCRRRDTLAAFVPGAPLPEPQPLRFRIAAPCQHAVEQLLESLHRSGLITGESCAFYTGGGLCEVSIGDLYGMESTYQQLFSHTQALMLPRRIELEDIPGTPGVTIRTNGLEVTDFPLEPLSCGGLLEALHAQGWLLGLRCHDGLADFTFAGTRLKAMLTDPGHLLTVCAFHRAKETGAFDDVRIRREINWEQSPAKPLFDCVLTKGFSTLFLTCRRPGTGTAAELAALAELAQCWGIHGKAVLLDLTGEPLPQQDAVAVISDPAEIEKIGEILLEITK